MGGDEKWTAWRVKSGEKIRERGLGGEKSTDIAVVASKTGKEVAFGGKNNRTSHTVVTPRRAVPAGQKKGHNTTKGKKSNFFFSKVEEGGGGDIYRRECLL